MVRNSNRDRFLIALYGNRILVPRNSIKPFILERSKVAWLKATNVNKMLAKIPQR